MTIEDKDLDSADRGDDMDQDAGAQDHEKDKDQDAGAADPEKGAADKDQEELDEIVSEANGKPKKGPAIPKERFDEAVGKERRGREEAEKRLQAAEAELAKVRQSFDADKVEKEIEDLEGQLDKAIADGNDAEKARLRREIRGKTAAIANAAAEARAAQATAVAVERINYDNTVKMLEAKFPQMDPDKPDSYDQEMVDELLELKGAYEATGMGSTKALEKAARYVFKEAPEAVKKEKEAGESAEDKAKRLAAEKVAAEKAAKAKEDAIRRGLEAKEKQPAADADKAGKQSDKRGAGDKAAEAAKMTDKDFDKMSDEDLARARGDHL